MNMPPFLTHAHARCSLVVPGSGHVPLALRLMNEPESRQYLKENVIIGRLIPAGTGFKGSPKEKLVNRYAPVAPEAAEDKARVA